MPDSAKTPLDYEQETRIQVRATVTAMVEGLTEFDGNAPLTDALDLFVTLQGDLAALCWRIERCYAYAQGYEVGRKWDTKNE